MRLTLEISILQMPWFAESSEIYTKMHSKAVVIFKPLKRRNLQVYSQLADHSVWFIGATFSFSFWPSSKL